MPYYDYGCELRCSWPDGPAKGIVKPTVAKKAGAGQLDMNLIKQANEAMDAGKPSTALSLFRRGTVGVDVETKPKLKAKMEACKAKLARPVASKAGKKQVLASPPHNFVFRFALSLNARGRRWQLAAPVNAFDNPARIQELYNEITSDKTLEKIHEAMIKVCPTLPRTAAAVPSALAPHGAAVLTHGVVLSGDAVV